MSKKKLYSILTLTSSTVGLAVALIFFLLDDASSFRPWTNYISDLGAGPFSATLSLGIMEGLIAIFVSLLMITMSKEIPKFGMRTLFLFLALFAQASLFTISIFPLDPSMPRSYETHRIVAILYFAFSGITDIILFGLEYKTNKLSAITILLAGLFSILFTVGFFLQEYVGIPRNMIVYLTEWIYFILAMQWIMLKIFPSKK